MYDAHISLQNARIILIKIESSGFTADKSQDKHQFSTYLGIITQPLTSPSDVDVIKLTYILFISKAKSDF